MKYIVEIPDELNQVITDMGFDVNSWFQSAFLKPLLDRYEESIKKEVLDNQQKVITNMVDDANKASSFIVVDDSQTLGEATPVAPVKPIQPQP